MANLRRYAPGATRRTPRHSSTRDALLPPKLPAPLPFVCPSLQSEVTTFSSIPEELVHCDADVLCNLSQEQRRHIPAGMIGHSRPAAILMAILHVRSPLPHQFEAKRLKNPANFPRLENGRLRHEIMLLLP